MYYYKLELKYDMQKDVGSKQEDVGSNPLKSVFLNTICKSRRL